MQQNLAFAAKTCPTPRRLRRFDVLA